MGTVHGEVGAESVTVRLHVWNEPERQHTETER